MRRDTRIAEVVARGTAVARTALGLVSGPVPSGLDQHSYVDEIRTIQKKSGSESGDPFAGELIWRNRGVFAVSGEKKCVGNLGRVSSDSPMAWVSEIDSGSAKMWPLHAQNPMLLAPHLNTTTWIETDRQRSTVVGMKRPDWAERMWTDRFGIAARFRLNDTPFTFRWIPAGEFWMGSPEDEKGRYERECPRHRVTITKGFWMGETTVTQGQWEAVTGEKSPSYFTGKSRPVENVTWDESVRFARRLSEEIPGLLAHLPTEAQWEYACRAGTESAFSDGSDCTNPGGKDTALEKIGWHGEGFEGATHEVMQLEANSWGLYDMHGNVWEWCRDDWEEHIYRKRKNGIEDPIVQSGKDSVGRVIRGGGYWGDAGNCRSAYRDRGEHGIRGQNLGIRLAAGQPEALGS